MDKTLKELVLIYLGIDPGKSGSISAVWSDGVPFVAHARGDDTEADIAAYLTSFDLTQARAVLERVSSQPNNGHRQAFIFGQSYGFLRGILAAYAVPFIEVSPQKWQKAMECLSGGDKNRTKAAAQRLWPRLKITHRNADSLLLAEYGRRYGWQVKEVA